MSTLRQEIRNRALVCSVLGVVAGAVAAVVFPGVGIVQVLWGGFLGGLGGGAASAVVSRITRR
jgi:hypothetical protein